MIHTSAESSTEGHVFQREEWRFGSMGCGCGSSGLYGSPNWFQSWLLLAAVLSICGTGLFLLQLRAGRCTVTSEQKSEWVVEFVI